MIENRHSKSSRETRILLEEARDIFPPEPRFMRDESPDDDRAAVNSSVHRDRSWYSRLGGRIAWWTFRLIVGAAGIWMVFEFLWKLSAAFGIFVQG